jgi:hypothetical protein
VPFFPFWYVLSFQNPATLLPSKVELYKLYKYLFKTRAGICSVVEGSLKIVKNVQ